MAENKSIASLYPPNWYEIAFEIKTKFHYTCQNCGRSPQNDPKCQISVHHLDHNTFNNDPSNLRVVCARCHFYYEREHKANLRQERYLNAVQASGQFTLEGFSPFPKTE